MLFGVVVFPGSNCDMDAFHVIREVLRRPCELVWHHESDLSRFDAIILPGGFSYGDYLRAGALAAFSPVLDGVREFAGRGKPVVGICNGFQILVEAGLLPGALTANRSLSFICRDVHLRVERADTPFTSMYRVGDVLRMPIAHQSGNYFSEKSELVRLLESRQVVFRYCDESGRVLDSANPNGSMEAIAGLLNTRGNVLGMMPHPERASESILGSESGLKLFESIGATLRQQS